ncbi:MAG: hypothetical protein IJ013_05390 [Bacteroidaceae bacterium]|nr:hypothetical protein [Bacteroidaceae bacterium]
MKKVDALEILPSVNSVQDDKTMEEENNEKSASSASSASKKSTEEENKKNPRNPRSSLEQSEKSAPKKMFSGSYRPCHAERSRSICKHKKRGVTQEADVVPLFLFY